jgi:hypothetical protein
MNLTLLYVTIFLIISVTSVRPQLKTQTSKQTHSPKQPSKQTHSPKQPSKQTHSPKQPSKQTHSPKPQIVRSIKWNTVRERPIVINPAQKVIHKTDFIDNYGCFPVETMCCERDFDCILAWMKKCGNK